MDKLVKSALSKGAVLSVRIGVGVPRWKAPPCKRSAGPIAICVRRRLRTGVAGSRDQEFGRVTQLVVVSDS